MPAYLRLLMLGRRRRHRLRNNTDRTVYLRESPAGKNYYNHETRLDPNSTIDDFPATIYRERDRVRDPSFCPQLPSEIIIFVGEDVSLVGLLPEMFIDYIELIFEMDEAHNKLIVYGILAQSTDYFPFRGILFPSSDYSGRARDIVLNCGFEAAETKKEGRRPLVLDDGSAYLADIRARNEYLRRNSQAPDQVWLRGLHSTLTSSFQSATRVGELTQDNKALRSRLSSLEEQVSYLMAIAQLYHDPYIDATQEDDSANPVRPCS